jgi:hypothetical protein
MAQHDYNIANQAGAAFRSDLNNALSAIATKNSGNDSPQTAVSQSYAYQEWVDTNASPVTLYIRDASVNTTWHTAAQYQTIGAGGTGDPWGFNDRKLYYRLNSAYTGSSVNTAQSLFGVGVSLAAGTIYEFTMAFTLTKASASNTTHTIGLGFGGTATLNNISYTLIGVLNLATNTPSVTSPDVFNYVQTASNTTMTGSVNISPTASTFRVFVTGTVSVDAAGTFIPQYTLSAAPGTAYSTTAGSHIRMMPLGGAGTINIGNWS